MITVTLVIIALFAFFILSCIIYFNSYVSRKEMMHFEKCDRISCKHCIDFEQCSIKETNTI